MIESINGLMTLLLMIIFIGICIWAWGAGNKEKFERMANLPLEEARQKPEVEDDE